MKKYLGDLRKMAADDAQLYGGAGKFVTPVTPERALYNEVLRTYAEAPDDLAILDGAIISEAQLSTAQGTKEIVFNVRADQPNPTNAIFPSEARLDTRDAFVVDRVTVQFANLLTAEITPAGNAPMNAQWQTFPNAAAAAASGAVAGGFGTNVQGIRMAYNGLLKCLVNSVQFMDSIDMASFLKADVIQSGILLATGGTTGWNTTNPGDHFKRLTPALNIWGSDKVQFQVSLPTAFTFSLASNTAAARFTARGLKVQGGAAYKN